MIALSNINSSFFTGVEFEIDKSSKRGKHYSTGRMSGYLRIKTKDDKDIKRKIIAPIRSIHVDPISNNAIECVCFPKSHSMKKILSLVSDLGYVQSGNMHLTFNDGCLMYGVMDDFNYSIEDEDGVSFVYQSKPLIFKSIIREISIRRPIIGLDNLDFNKIPDRFLFAFGFKVIEDLFGRMPNMWYGSIEQIFSLSGLYSEEAISKKINQFTTILKQIVE